MAYLLLLVAVLALVVVGVRFWMLKRSLRHTADQLWEIERDVANNRILKMELPDKDVEYLLSAINQVLTDVRQERNLYAQREREFQSQIEAISHDLRTPLTVVLGYLRLLQKEVDCLPEHRQESSRMLDTALRKAQGMQQLIGQFYDYSRLNAGDFKMALQPVDAGRVLREVFADYCVLLEQANLEAEADIPDCPVWVEVNKEGLERIFVNLLQNIVRYAHSWVKVGLKQEKSRVVIQFENDNESLCQQDMDYLFQRFYMKDKARSGAGSGLGLTIVKSLAQQMGGDLQASLQEGDTCQTGQEQGKREKTIRFTLYLPLEE